MTSLGPEDDLPLAAPATEPLPENEPPLESEPPPQTEPAATVDEPRGGTTSNMLPARERRRLGVERLLIRIVATGGIVGIGVALGAILAASNVQGWIIGLVVALVSVVLAAILWSSRQL